MGTFSKSLATVGGFIAGESVVVDYIKHHARSEIFSAAPPPASVAAAMAALEIVENEPERRKQLWEHTDYMRHELNLLGFVLGVDFNDLALKLPGLGAVRLGRSTATAQTRRPGQD